MNGYWCNQIYFEVIGGIASEGIRRKVLALAWGRKIILTDNSVDNLDSTNTRIIA